MLQNRSKFSAVIRTPRPNRVSPTPRSCRRKITNHFKNKLKYLEMSSVRCLRRISLWTLSHKYSLRLYKDMPLRKLYSLVKRIKIFPEQNISQKCIKTPRPNRVSLTHRSKIKKINYIRSRNQNSPP